MAKIEKLWFEDGRIYICTDEKQVLSRPLEVFPSLKDATEQERQDFKIDRFGDAVRWEGIDEDIHKGGFENFGSAIGCCEICALYAAIFLRWFQNLPKRDIEQITDAKQSAIKLA